MRILTGALLVMTGALGCSQGGSYIPVQEVENPDSTTWGPGPVISTNSPRSASMDIGAVHVIAKRTKDYSHQVQIRLDASLSRSKATDVCKTEAECNCQFEWDQINGSGTNATRVRRIVRSEVSLVQDYLINCYAPIDYDVEIPAGTVFLVRVVQFTDDKNAVTVSTTVKKRRDLVEEGGSTDGEGTGDGSGAPPPTDFCDELLHCYTDIYQYTCYEKVGKGMKIHSRTIKKEADAAGTEVPLTLATKYCIDGQVKDASSGSTGGGEECPNLSQRTSSAQSYYYNLFVPGWKLGSFNLQNQVFTCPEVFETLDNSTVKKPWPWSANFALSPLWSPETNVGVHGHSILGIEGDSTGHSGNTYCRDMKGGEATQSSGEADSTVMAARCLGYAALPEPDGSCPDITIEKNGTKSTVHQVRLRRYIAVYPVQFDSNGAPMKDRGQAIDAVYVADRISDRQNRSYFTYRGPLPCPFAYFDRNGIVPKLGGRASGTGGVPGYWGTNYAGWDLLNVDGTKFPNQDDSGATLGEPMCSAAVMMPKYADDGSIEKLYLGTTHTSNQGRYSISDSRSVGLANLYIRGVTPYYLHYEEDSSFRACVPPAVHLSEPPLHFFNDANGFTRWCAEAYPNTHGAAAFLRTQLENPSINPTTQHPNGSTRTVAGDGQAAQQFPFYPLLAPAEDVEEVLRADDSFGCRITHAANMGSDKTGITVPTGGCCGNIQPARGSGAHSEPAAMCRAPQY